MRVNKPPSRLNIFSSSKTLFSLSTKSLFGTTNALCSRITIATPPCLAPPESYQCLSCLSLSETEHWPRHVFSPLATNSSTSYEFVLCLSSTHQYQQIFSFVLYEFEDSWPLVSCSEHQKATTVISWIPCKTTGYANRHEILCKGGCDTSYEDPTASKTSGLRRI